MLTADLVDARRKDGELLLRKTDDAAREEALHLGRLFLEAARAHVGLRREELEDAWDAIGDDATRRKLPLGLRKLVADACTFEPSVTIEPAELRQALFTRASETRRTREDGETWDRAAVIAEVAASLGIAPEALERGLFADLRGEHVLREAPKIDPASLAHAWELGQGQAVLLTASKITCAIHEASPGVLRAFFAKLKFHRLLFSAEKTDAGWSLVVDGPMSMFEATTKYGVKLALLLPALRELERWSLVAEIRWGKAKEPLIFRMSSEDEDGAPAGTAKRPLGRARKAIKPHLSDDVEALASGVARAAGPWTARPAQVILDVPGHGVCIPDLELRRSDGPPVYVEVLGFWSRAAVFKRIELAQQGLAAKVIFAVNARLRVSAELLDGGDADGKPVPASLYVFKSKPNARTLLEHAERLHRDPRGDE